MVMPVYRFAKATSGKPSAILAKPPVPTFPVACFVAFARFAPLSDTGLMQAEYDDGDDYLRHHEDIITLTQIDVDSHGTQGMTMATYPNDNLPTRISTAHEAVQWLMTHRTAPDSVVAIAVSDPMMAAALYLGRRDLQSDRRVRNAISSSPDAALTVLMGLNGECRDPDFIRAVCSSPDHAARVWNAFPTYRGMRQIMQAIHSAPTSCDGREMRCRHNLAMQQVRAGNDRTASR